MTRRIRTILAVLALTACSSKEPPVPTRDVTSAQALVEQYAQATLEFSGEPAFNRYALSHTPCQGRAGEQSDTIYAVLGTYQLLVPADSQPAVIGRVRSGWQAGGYTITEDRSFPPDGSGLEPGGQISATTPTDGVEIIFGTGVQPAMFLQINTPCYQPPT